MFYIDLDLRAGATSIDTAKLEVIKGGIATTEGIKVRFAPSKDLLDITKICPNCFKLECHYCQSDTDRNEKRKNISRHKESKKKAYLAHLEAAFK